MAIDGDCALQTAKHKLPGQKIDSQGLVDEIASEIDVLSLYTQTIVLAAVIQPEDMDKYKRMLEVRNMRYKFYLLKPSYQTAFRRCQTRICHNSVTPEYWINYFYNILVFHEGAEVIDNKILGHIKKSESQYETKSWKHNKINASSFYKTGDNRTRTCDPLHVKQMLSQLSYVSETI